MNQDMLTPSRIGLSAILPPEKSNLESDPCSRTIHQLLTPARVRAFRRHFAMINTRSLSADDSHDRARNFLKFSTHLYRRTIQLTTTHALQNWNHESCLCLNDDRIEVEHAEYLKSKNRHRALSSPSFERLLPTFTTFLPKQY